MPMYDMYNYEPPKTPDQIEQQVLSDFANRLPENPQEIAVEAIHSFRKELSKNGYVLYQP